MVLRWKPSSCGCDLIKPVKVSPARQGGGRRQLRSREGGHGRRDKNCRTAGQSEAAVGSWVPRCHSQKCGSVAPLVPAPCLGRVFRAAEPWRQLAETGTKRGLSCLKPEPAGLGHPLRNHEGLESGDQPPFCLRGGRDVSQWRFQVSDFVVHCGAMADSGRTGL